MKTDDEIVLEAMTEAMFHLRMKLAGFSSYSGTPSKIDKGWAEEVLDRLRHRVDMRPADRSEVQRGFKQVVRPTEGWLDR